MRRKQKRGVYTNRTIKSCPTCNNYCINCKSICKIDKIGSIDYESIAENHPVLNSSIRYKKLHHYGIGSLKQGKKLICYCWRSHRHPKMSMKEINKKYSENNRFRKFDLSEQISMYEISEINKNNLYDI